MTVHDLRALRRCIALVCASTLPTILSHAQGAPHAGAHRPARLRPIPVCGAGKLFENPLTPTGTSPANAALADLDADGDLDVAVTNYGEDTLTVILNRGDGSALASATYATASRPWSVVAGDLDADGDADLAVSNRVGNTILIFLNSGDGALVASAALSTANDPVAIALCDVDLDGDPDCVAIHRNAGSLWVWRNLGNASFAAPEIYASGPRPEALDVGDIDGDGDADLIVACSGTSGPGQIKLHRNLAAGVFAPPTTLSSAPRQFRCARVCDLDGDVDLDIAVTFDSTVDAGLMTFRNNGGGAFVAGAPLVLGNVGGQITVTDFELDGDPDLVVTAGSASGSLYLLRNTSGALALEVGTSTSTLAMSAASGDLDGDGDADLLAVESVSNAVAAFSNDGTGAFAARERVANGVQQNSPFALRDLDGDGDLDLAVATYQGATTAVFTNTGQGSFGPASIVMGSSTQLVAGDIDADGDVDLVVARSTPSGVTVARNDGNGAFAIDATYPMVQRESLALADLDGDLDLDVAGTNAFTSSIAILLNQGNGTYVAGAPAAAHFNARAIVAVDVERDGDVDLVVQRSGGFSVLRNLGAATFAAPELYDQTIGWRFTVGDVDGDLFPDFMTSDPAFAAVVVRPNQGDGTFGGAGLFSAHSPSYDIAIADIDGDGVSDLVTSDPQTASVSVLRGAGLGAFLPPRSYDVGRGPTLIAVADLDGDGDQDALTTAHAVGVIVSLGVCR